jgi:hypothetical protein
MLDEAALGRIPQTSNLFRFPTLKTFLKAIFIRPQCHSQTPFPSCPSLIAVLRSRHSRSVILPSSWQVSRMPCYLMCPLVRQSQEL